MAPKATAKPQPALRNSPAITAWRLLCLALAGVAAYVAFRIFNIDYQYIINKALAQNSRVETEADFAAHLQADILPADVFERLQIGGIWGMALLVGLLLSFALLPQIWRRPLGALGHAVQNLRHILGESWQALPAAERWGIALLAVGFVAFRLVVAWLLPPTADEANVYTTFVRHGPLVSWVYYPIPSNHVLHTLLWCLADAILPDFGPQTGVWAGRLPVVLAGGAAGVAGYVLMRRWAGPLGAWVGTLIFFTSYMEYIYGVLARGYGLCVLCAMLIYAAILHLRQAPRSSGAWLLIALNAAVGLCVVPAFYIPLAGLAVVGLVELLAVSPPNRRLLLMGWLVALTSAAVLTLLFYTPLLLWGGWPGGRIGPIDGAFDSLQAYVLELSHVAGFLSPLKPDDAFVYDARPYLALVLAAVVVQWVRPTAMRLRLLRHVLIISAIALGVLPSFQGYVAPAKVYAFLMPFWLWLLTAAVAALAEAVVPTDSSGWRAWTRRLAACALGIIFVVVNLTGGARHYRHHFAPDLAAAQVAHQASHPPCHCTLVPRNEAERAVLRYYAGEAFVVAP